MIEGLAEKLRHRANTMSASDLETRGLLTDAAAEIDYMAERVGRLVAFVKAFEALKA